MTIPSDLGPSAEQRNGAGLRCCRPPVTTDGAPGIALGLGGGFSRGFAHLGVLEVLEQERIPVTAIAGTSIGGLLGAAYADGIPVQILCELGRKVRVRDFIRYHRQDENAQRNDRISQFVREWFQAIRIEELSMPLAIVTTDIETCAPYIFTRGSIEVAIRATCAFPGLFRPVEHEGRKLADGCIVSPVPTATAARMSGSCVLGVAVSSNKVAPSSSRVVQIFDQMKVCRRRRIEPSWTRHADFLLQPDVQQIAWDDFSRVDEARAAGADAMRRALPFVRDLIDRKAQQRGVAGISGQPESRASL